MLFYSYIRQSNTKHYLHQTNCPALLKNAFLCSKLISNRNRKNKTEN